MISQKTQLETKVKGLDHKYQCEPNCPLVDCLEALDTFRFYIIGRIKEAKEAEESCRMKVEEVSVPVQEEIQVPTVEEVKEDPKPEEGIDGNQQ